jgi:phosphoribosylamine--glycine ligase
MNILLIGNGGREHAMAMKMAESTLCDRLYCSPGNPGTDECAENVPLDLGDMEALGRFLEENAIDLIVSGPEQPLVDGLHDRLLESGALDGRCFFGPEQAGAQLEGSKDFAKEFMVRNQIPTAAYRSFHATEKQQAKEYLQEVAPPFVLKADGLAAGKGVIITETIEEAEQALDELMGGALGDAGKTVVIEAFLKGREFSVFVMTNGEDALWLPAAKDYKRIGEGDVGPNTGGMGSISPVPFLDETLRSKVDERIVQRTLKGLKKEKLPFLGFLFFGLIEVEGEPFVIEYNVRLGDPETQSILPRTEGDLLAAMWDLAHGNAPSALGEKEEHSASVILASKGYPGSYTKGEPISLNGLGSHIRVIHAGTAHDGSGRLVTSGGRVLAVNALGGRLSDCLENVYAAIGKIEFDGMQYRRDIGSGL